MQYPRVDKPEIVVAVAPIAVFVGSSDRESGGATSIGGNLSDSTTDVLSANEEQSNDTSLQTSQPWLQSNASSQMHGRNSSS
ncbi:hypothetical protein V1478_000120 [Vespula squamosa]|uniref:Uncharacterized protein n=1 Tax=Vespula squamosa TaxID=30214 RepID=A0ABD2C932_VESSQ